MSLLVEIATRAEVPLEAVVRVLTREPVNDDHKTRILEVLDHLDAEETRVLQRFALAAVHDELRPVGHEGTDHEALVAELVDDPLDLPEAVLLELGPGPAQEPGTSVEEAEFEAAPPAAPQALDPAPLVQLGSVLGELTEAVRELRHETDAERRERVDDLAVLIDLITKGWEGVDRRLGRVERQLGRLESAPPPQEAAARIEPAPVPTPPEPPAPAPDDGDEEGRGDRSSALRQRLPLFAALAFGIAIGAAAALDLPSRLDASTVTDRSLTAEAAERTAVQRSSSAATTTAKQPSQPPSRPRTTPQGTASSTTSAGPVPAAPATTATADAERKTTTAPQAPTTSAPPRASPRPRSPGTRATPPRSDFTPSRTWAWPPVADADYYLVEFFRDGEPLYRARPTAARLTLPRSVQFTPAVYRWRVRPGRGAPSANLFGDPIVDSEFTVAG